jgi:predicted nucleotidyltransferase
LAALNLIDRDAIVTREGLIFRVLGYSHPQDAYFCDLEYAPATVFHSSNPKAPRGERQPLYYKFYEDEAWRFLETRCPQYLIDHQMLNKHVVGVRQTDVAEARRPDETLKRLMKEKQKDMLVKSMMELIKITAENLSVKTDYLGVFGSVFHGFHHPKLSDIDLVVYGKENVRNLLIDLRRVYLASDSALRNEFDDEHFVAAKNWRFVNYTREEYSRHQRTKLIYAVFQDPATERLIKVEFEPVKGRTEAINDYDSRSKILQKGWVKVIAKVSSDEDAAYMPSCYAIEPIEVVNGEKEAAYAERIVSYMEEFRLQACVGDRIYVEGNLEEVVSPQGRHFQIALTCCPRYYEQVLKKCDLT